jgi:hypothetical protein
MALRARASSMDRRGEPLGTLSDVTQRREAEPRGRDGRAPQRTASRAGSSTSTTPAKTTAYLPPKSCQAVLGVPADELFAMIRCCR